MIPFNLTTTTLRMVDKAGGASRDGGRKGGRGRRWKEIGLERYDSFPTNWKSGSHTFPPFLPPSLHPGLDNYLLQTPDHKLDSESGIRVRAGKLSLPSSLPLSLPPSAFGSSL